MNLNTTTSHCTPRQPSGSLRWSAWGCWPRLRQRRRSAPASATSVSRSRPPSRRDDAGDHTRRPPVVTDESSSAREGSTLSLRQRSRSLAQGTFVDPDSAAYEGKPAPGSGFVVGPTRDRGHQQPCGRRRRPHPGVTCPGEPRPRNAKVLGVSECSDLAVIDIDGDDIPALSWYDGEATPGLEIYAAGYPLGDPEYTLTRGIVSKGNSLGETGWASVDHVLEHDAVDPARQLRRSTRDRRR